MLNSLPDIVHDISQDNDDDGKHAAQLLKICIHYYLIHKVELNKAAKLQRDKRAKETALLIAPSLPDKLANACAAAIKAAAKK